jgi:polar amino acid transport system substrate-binding protein
LGRGDVNGYSRDIKLKSLEDAKNYMTGTIIGDLRESYLIEHGFWQGNNVESVTSNEMNYEKLKARRIDLWPATAEGMAYIVRKAGDDPRQMLKPVWEITDFTADSANYMAFGAQTGDDVVEVFRQGLVKIKSNGVYAAILRKWEE